MGCGDSKLQTNIGKQIPVGLGPIFRLRIHEIRRRRIRKYTLLASGDDNNNIIDNEVASSPVNKLCLSFPNNNYGSSLSNIKTCRDSNAGDNGDMDNEKRVMRHEHGRELIFAAGSPSFKVYLQEVHKNDDALINHSTVPSEETASSSVHVEQEASKDCVRATKRANKCRKRRGRGITRRVIEKGGGVKNVGNVKSILLLLT